MITSCQQNITLQLLVVLRAKCYTCGEGGSQLSGKIIRVPSPPLLSNFYQTTINLPILATELTQGVIRECITYKILSLVKK